MGLPTYSLHPIVYRVLSIVMLALSSKPTSTELRILQQYLQRPLPRPLPRPLQRPLRTKNIQRYLRTEDQAIRYATEDTQTQR